MNPIAMLPAPDALPVPSLWFEGLGVLTLALHLVLTNVLVGGGIIAVWLTYTDRKNEVGGAITNKLPTIFALAVNLGVAPLLFLQVVHGQFFYTSAVMSSVWWLTIIPLLILGYYSLYIHQHKQKADLKNGPVYLLIALGMMISISLVLTSVFTTMETPGMWVKYFTNAQGTIVNFFETTTMPRYLHFFLASLAIGGLFSALLADCTKLKDVEGAAKVKVMGMKLFTTCTMLQMAVGLWWLFALEQSVMLQFMGSNTLATGLLIVAVGLTFPTLLAGFSGKPKPTAAWLLVTILLMVTLRAVVRTFTLFPYFSTSDLTVIGEYSPMVLFFVSLVIGLGVLGYMLRLCNAPKEEV